MESLMERIETLEQQVQTLTKQTRRLRWWRRLAFGLTVLTAFNVPLSLNAGPEVVQRGPDESGKGLPQRIRALERTLQHVTSVIGDNGRPELVITGANLRIVNGLGRTACLEGETFPGCPNGVGNLIVGYNEPPAPGSGDAIRTGSHNVVVGQELNHSGFGGLVVGFSNTISGGFASVSGGFGNNAGGGSSVTGGIFNVANHDGASVSGGIGGIASGIASSVSGGEGNRATSIASSVSGGSVNTAGGQRASISGGGGNTADGELSSVSGGGNRIAFGDCSWVAGSFFVEEDPAACPRSGGD